MCTCFILFILDSLGPGLALGEKEKKTWQVKKIIGERSELQEVVWGRGKGGGAWRHAFDAVDPPSSN